jgi:transketolase
VVNTISIDFQYSSMRTACLPVMETLGEKVPHLITMGADGQAIFGDFAKRFPERFIDVGIAEANLIGVAAGLARAGKIVFVATIGSFLLRRAYEQIRIDVCDPKLPVKLIAVGGGLSYGTLGPTHHLTEDIALTRVLPNVAVFIPSDSHDAVGALHAALEWNGPAYVRLGTGTEPVLHRGDEAFDFSQPEVLRSGQELTIFATGYCVSQALLAAHHLERSGHDVGVVNVSRLKPLNSEAVIELARGRRAVVSVEEHSLAGGVGSILAEIFSGNPICPLLRMGIPDWYPPVGTREELIAFYKLDHLAIAKAVRDYLERP